MDRQEMVDDIIEEMLGARTEFPFVYLMGEPDTPEVVDFTTKKIIEPRKINIHCVTVKELADRLKAARKRERGDCAKLREALVSLRDAARDFRHQIVYTKYNDIMDEYTCHEKGLPAVLTLRDAIPKANLALAATEKEGGAK